VGQPEAYRAVVHELLADPAVSEAQMMGMPVLKVGRKLFGLHGGIAPMKLVCGEPSPFSPEGWAKKASVH
jgi:hypothetical protein